MEDRGVHRGIGAAELLLFALVVWAGVAGLVPFSSTPALLVLGTVALHLRRVGWRGVGLRTPAAWQSAVRLGAVAGIGYQIVSLLVVEPLIGRLVGGLPDVSVFRPLIGDWSFLLLSLLVTWTLAAFGEELAYRGYLISLVAGLGDARPGAWVAAAIVSAVVFGLAHVYQGPAGIITTGLSGAVFGALYLRTGRNLWAPIVAHGSMDTLGFVLVFLGAYPGV